MLKTLFLFLLFCTSYQSLLAQYSLTDTIKLLEINVLETKHFKPAGFKINSLEAIQIETKKLSSLDELLQHESGINLKNYGAGKLASIGIRGSAASDVQVVWNGMKINSLFTGQTDFSSIPMLISDKISVVSGNTSFGLNSGAIGGTVLLSSEPENVSGTTISAYSETGSFKTLRNSFGINNSYKKLIYKVLVYQNSADNTSLFSKSGMQGGKNNAYGIIQENYFKINPRTNYAIKFWFQESNNQLSADIIKEEFQHDKFIRVVSNLKTRFAKSTLSYTSAYSFSTLTYQMPISNINSRNNLQTLQNTLELNGNVLKKIAWRSGLNLEIYNAKSNNFSKNITSFLQNAYFGGNLNISKKAEIYLFSNFEYNNKYSFAIQPSIGFNYQFAKYLTIRANISKNRKTPSLNDLYWQPGGNEFLIPEQSISTETGIVFSNSSEPLIISAEITGFYGLTENRIIWQPIANSTIWSPINIEELKTSGLEFSVKGKYTLTHSSIQTRLNLSYTNAQTTKSANESFLEKQAIFIPKISGSHWLAYTFNKYQLTFDYSFVGKRYITRDNTEFLPPYTLINLGNWYRFQLKNSAIQFGFEVNNLLNTYYESIPNHPMYGRTFKLKLNLSYEKP